MSGWRGKRWKVPTHPRPSWNWRRSLRNRSLSSQVNWSLLGAAGTGASTAGRFLSMRRPTTTVTGKPEGSLDGNDQGPFLLSLKWTVRGFLLDRCSSDRQSVKRLDTPIDRRSDRRTAGSGGGGRNHGRTRRGKDGETTTGTKGTENFSIYYLQQ